MPYRHPFINDTNAGRQPFVENLNSYAARNRPPDPLGYTGDQFVQHDASFHGDSHASIPFLPRHVDFQPSAWQARDERDSHSAEEQANRKDNETENSELDKYLSSAQDDTQLADRHEITRPSQEEVAWTASRVTEEEGSSTSLPVHSSAPLSSTNDMLRHAIQTQSDQLNRPTAAMQPPARCSNAVPTKRLDGSTVDFHPKVSTKKILEQKTLDEDHPVPTVPEDTSSSISTNTKDAPNEKHLVNSATANQHETTQPPITESTANIATEARIKALEDEQTNTRRNIDALKQLYDELCNSIKHLKTQEQARPQTPRTSSPASKPPVNDRCYYIPRQGNLSNDTFLFAIKLLAGRKISASRWDRTRLQVQGGVTGSRGIASQAQSTAHWDGAGSEDESEVVSQDEEGIEDGGVAVGGDV